MPKVIKSSAREIVLKVHSFCAQECERNEVIIPLKSINARVAAITGVSERSVQRILAEGKHAEATSSKIVTPGKKRKRSETKSNLDSIDLGVLRRKIQQFYTVKKEVPTLAKVLVELRTEIQFDGSSETLRKLILRLGFKFRKCKSKRMILMERYDIAAWRSRYLRTMKLNRESENRRPVIYLDETYIHSSYGVNKCWQSEEVAGSIKEISLGQRWIIVHAGSVEGFVPNALLVFKSNTKSGVVIHDEMNATNFKKWLVEKLIPNLPPQSIVVMDNAPYHSVKMNKPPTMSSLKKDMQEWIKNNNLSYLDVMTKTELYEIIKLNKKPDVFEADEILKNLGHKVVRLPPYHCDLNPIELIWASVKRKVAETNVGRSKADVINLVQDAFQAVTAATWKAHCEHVERLEDEYCNDDIELVNFNICLDSDSDTSSDSNSSEFEDVEDHLLDHSYSRCE